MRHRCFPSKLFASIRVLVLLALAFTLGACNFFLNETFVYDVPAPVVEPVDAADAEW